MTREEFFARIAPLRDRLDAAGVGRIGVFGSVARNEARPDSDVDVLVEFRVVPDLTTFMSVKRLLENALGARVDLCTPGGLRPRVRVRVLHDVKYAA